MHVVSRKGAIDALKAKRHDRDVRRRATWFPPVTDAVCCLQRQTEESTDRPSDVAGDSQLSSNDCVVRTASAWAVNVPAVARDTMPSQCACSLQLAYVGCNSFLRFCWG